MHRKTPQAVSRAATTAALALALLTAATGLPADAGARLDERGVVALLEVMDAVARLHPGFETATAAATSEAELEALRAAGRERNRASAELAAAVERMLSTETYRVYFRRFSNLTPELLRDLVLDLPHRCRPAPGDVGRMLCELVRRRGEVRARLERFLDQIDLARVHGTALHWLPGEGHPVPTMHLIWDSNAGSFAAEGMPFFNLYTSGILGELAGGEASIRDAELVMAHELHHALAEPFLAAGDDRVLPWDRRWIGRLTRGMVGEGAANHCNPPAGFKRQLYEDPEVVATLVARLEELLGRLRDGSLDEPEMRRWMRDSYFAAAESLLRRHLERRFAGDELEAMMRRHMPLRPDIEHALGWWMVSRISLSGERRSDLLALLEDPSSLYRRYNRAVAAAYPELRLSAAAVTYLERLLGAGATERPRNPDGGTAG